ncbi:nuclear transport factor 2 family protein [Gordonia zhaorongruii]|uniref:nuclear transport factor 2 family protein n=1 Tax=Gordonia zhaorongruii TaxID=2597659 RepID=UPI0010465D5A|nr:nuclear transport factor 2 family protein [Gordonia zhaorongruii]
MTSADPTLADLVSRQEIHDVVLRYCRGIDRRDFDLVRDCYHPGAVDHHGDFTGPVDAFIVWVDGQLAQLGGTHHQVGNQLCERNGDDAVLESYVTATHWADPDKPLQAFLTTGLRYVDHFQRRAGRWAIAERWAVRDWTRWETRLVGPADHSDPQPGHGDADPIERLRARILG